MGICWARYYFTVIIMCFCNVFLLAGTATDACAWRSDFAQAHEQPDYPGIRKHFIERTAKDGGTITMYYPETGNAAVDEAILAVITTELNSFEKDSSEDSTKNPADNSTEGSDIGRAISSNYVIHRPSPTSLGVEFTLCTEHSKEFCFCYKHNLNFSLVDGRLLTLEDMFEDRQVALKLMSTWSRRALPKEVPYIWTNKDSIQKATMPSTENFHNQLIIPNGLRLVFDVGQVGPMAVGNPELDMPLKALAAAGPRPEVWGKQENPREAALNTPLQTPLPEKMQVSQDHATFLVPAGNGLNFSCIDSGSEIENCIRIAPEFMAHFEDAASDFAFVQGQVAHAGAAEATYIWGLYRTAGGFRSTPPVMVCQGCKPSKIFIKKNAILFTKIKHKPSDAQAVDLKFRIADGKLKRAN